MIFLYHGVLADPAPEARWCIGQALPLKSVRQQLLWLARRFRMVPLSEYLAGPPRKHLPRLAAVTFDDGAKTTYENVTSVLRREGIPATFFVTTGHMEGGPLLWFSYLNAVCFEGIFPEVTVGGQRFALTTLEEKRRARRTLGAMAKLSGHPAAFVAQMAATYSLPLRTLDAYGGMTRSQVAAAGRDDLLEIGSHTVTHPYLTGVSGDEQATEMTESKRVLSDLIGRQVRYFAYPGGDYDASVLSRVRASGYEAALATHPLNVGTPKFEVARVGIYSQSMLKVKLKAAGLVSIARPVGIRIG